MDHRDDDYDDDDEYYSSKVMIQLPFSSQWNQTEFFFNFKHRLSPIAKTERVTYSFHHH